jgi:hypothetical protein
MHDIVQLVDHHHGFVLTERFMHVQATTIFRLSLGLTNKLLSCDAACAKFERDQM